MSIKDLFGRKTVVVKNAESASIDAESNRFVLRKAEQNETYVPPVDFATASNFVRFGSAEEYYEASVRRVYSEYPYDGSAADKILYSLSSSYFDRYILEQRYPSSTGYGILSPTGYGAGSKVNGYGLNASSSDYEYIWIGGGVRPAPQNQNDPSSDDANIPLYKKFKYGTFYEEGTDKTTVFSFSAVSGSTFEFWLKKKSFDTANTEKEVILDLWNGVATSSAQYGRITIELDATNEGGDGANPLRLTYQNGTVGVYRQSLASGSFTTSDIADDKWHHWAISTMPRIDNATTTNYLDLKLYKDGVVINQQSIVTTSSAGSSATIGNIVGRLDGYMGALIAPVWDGKSGSTTGAKYAGKLSASLDEFRFWKKRISSHEIYNNWYHPIGGGANTDKYREHLALYYKFNEGITTTSSIDSVVLDYSGRVANGSWTGYSANSRNTGSCFVSASVLAHEPLDPIIRSNHQSVKDLISELQISGSQYDLNNSAYMYDMVPFWMREEDFDIGDNNLKKIYQIIASYFDTLYLQIESLPDLKTKQYFSMDKKPYPFSKQLLEHNGLIVPDLFVSQGVLEKFSQRDDQNKKFEYDMDDLKKRIYYNIYNNLKTIYESKGTEKSYRNLLRCFGIDDEIVKLNLYTDYGIQYLTDKVKYSSQKTKFLNHNISANFTGRVFNTSSVGNPRTFISGSGPLLNREEFLAFTMETDVIIPTKLKVGDLNYFPTDFLTSSIMGFHQADPSDPHNFAWHGADDANLQVHLVRPINESEDAKFVITNNAKTIFAESETFKGIYNNERWALGLKVYPAGYPFSGHVANSSTPTYVAELYGVTHNLNDVQREFTITASMSHAEGSAILVNAKRFYAGCEATNFTGTPHQYSDLKIGACRLWYDKLDNAVLKQHNLDASNYGHNKIHGNPTPYVDGLKDVHIPSAEALAFNWDFQQVTASDSNGRFVVEDFSSGTSADRYGWIDDLILRENRGGGFGYETGSKKIVDNEFIFSAKKELPEISFTSDGVFIKGDEETYFSEDEDTTDNVFAFEKSMYQVVSEEILKTFSTVTEYANLFMKPVDHYREEYKRLDHFKELYFERVENDMDFERFTNYFKFIDASVSIFIQQLHPAMAKFNEGISDMVESHILERPKYKRQFPLIVTRDTIPDGKMAGVKERKYPWREGHAPDYRETFDENDHCFWQKERRSIKPSGSHVRDSVNQNLKLDELRKVIVSETDGKAKNLGTTPPYSSYTITFGNGSGGGGMPAAGENITFAFPSVSLLVSFNGGDGSTSETAFSQTTANELKIDVGDDVDWSALGFASAAERVASIIRTALINYTGAGLGPTALDLAVIPDLTADSSDRILVLTANRHGHYGLTFSDNATNIIITNISNTRRPNIYQGSTYAVRSFSRQYDFTYEEQKVIHGGTNYGHQKNRDFVLDHLKPHGGVSRMGVPQEVITVGVGKGLGVLGLDKCKNFTDPYQPVSGAYTARHLEKAEYRFVGTVGRYADGTGDQPKSDEVDQLFKVKGHSSFPFNLVSGTIATGYNKKIHDKYDDDFILTNLHSDTTTPSNDVPMQGPFAEAWVGGRQFRHIPMNRYNKDLKSVSTNTAQIGPRRSLSWASTSLDAVYGSATLDSALDLDGTKSTCQIVYAAGITASDKLTLTHPDNGDYEITFASGPGTGTETTFRTVDGQQKANIDINVANNAASQSNAVAVLLNSIPDYTASANGVDTVTLTATAAGSHWTISLAGAISGLGQTIGSVTAGDDALTQRAPFSISFWLKIPNDDSDGKTIFQIDPDPIAAVSFGVRAWVQDNDLYVRFRNSENGYAEYKYNNDIPNNEWAHYVIEIDPTSNIAAGFFGNSFTKVYINNVQSTFPTVSTGGGFTGHSDKALVGNLKTFRIGDMGNSGYDGSNEFELKGGLLQDLALWNKELSSADRTLLYNGGRSIWPNIVPSGSAAVNWWTLGEEEAIKSLPIGSTIPVRLDTEFRSVLGQKSRLHFPNSSVISIQQGHPGHLHNTKNYLDDQFTRPEAFRILVGDHPSEPVKDGALGMVGPDYGGPYPDTTRQMAVHYREERAKRPFNIRNIQYATSSAILGNFKENYEVVHSVGRSTNNRKLVEFASVSSSLTSPIGLILPQTTNQASLFGSTPLLSGNVFLAGDRNTSNRTLDRPRVERYSPTGVKASGSFFFRDDQYYYGGSFASGSLHVSGSTLYSRATGSFTMSGSHVSGAHSQGHFTLAYPNLTVSEGDFVITGSFIHGAEASGSVTPAAPPSLTVSTGEIVIGNATTFGTPAVGSFKVGDMPLLTTSSGSFQAARAFVAGTAASNGAFQVGNKTTYETQYTGSFKLQGPADAGRRGHLAFDAKGMTMSDGDGMHINADGVFKKIQADTNGATSGSPHIVARGYRRALGADVGNTFDAAINLSKPAVDVGNNSFTFAFWFNNTTNDTSLNQSWIAEDNSGNNALEIQMWGNDDWRIRIYNTDGHTSDFAVFAVNTATTNQGWNHYIFVCDGTSEPELYLNGSTTSFGSTGYSDPGGTRRIIEQWHWYYWLDDSTAMHDMVIFNKVLSQAERTELYNSGEPYDYSTHSAQSNIKAWWKLGEESVFDGLYGLSNFEGQGPIVIPSSYGGAGSITIPTSRDEDFKLYAGVPRSNTEIWDDLKDDLNTEFPLYTTTYRSGSSTAEFYMVKDAFPYVNSSLYVGFTGSTYVLVDGIYPQAAVASELKEGDNITIEGDTFEIRTKTKPHATETLTIDAADTRRKAIHFKENSYGTTSTGLRNNSYAMDNPDPDWISFSWWMKVHGQDGSSDCIFQTQNASSETGLLLWHDDDDFELNVHASNQNASNQYTWRSNATDPVSRWNHYLLVIKKSNMGVIPTMFKNGVRLPNTHYTDASTAYSGTTLRDLQKITLGDTNATDSAHEMNGSMCDFVIWNMSASLEDSQILYNSGSSYNLYSHPDVAKISDWWRLGDDVAPASGSTLNSGNVMSIPPTIGKHNLSPAGLDGQGNAHIYVSDGIPSAWKSDATIFTELKTLIVANTLYQEVNGVSTTTFSTSGNTATFTLTDTLPSAPTAFSNNANQGFHTLVGPTANGDDISVPTGGSVDGHYVDVGSVRFYVDSDNSHAGGNYAENSGDYYVYSNAADDATWWARFAAAVNAGVATHTTTHTGGGTFDIVADAAGTAGNIPITSNGSTFSATANVAGGIDAQNTANGKGINFRGATGSLDGNTSRRVYVYKDLTTKIASVAGDSPIFIQDGVWLHPLVHNRYYYVSSTGSSAGSSGTDSVLWQRITASLAHGFNSMVGAPAVTSSPNSSFKITDLGGGSFGALIEFTGSYTLTNGHDFSVGKSNLSATGDEAISIVDTTVNGHGRPYHGSVSGSYDSRPDFSVDGVNFRFTYPYNSYNDGGNIALRPTGSKTALLTHMRDLLEANVPSFDFTLGSGGDANKITMTGTVTGSSLNNKITDNAWELVEFVTQTAGGTFETGAGHGRGINISYPGLTGLDSRASRLLSVQTMASASSLNPDATLLANGIMWDNSGAATGYKDYYISSTGSDDGTSGKTNGVNGDYWGRWRYALAHAVGSATGVTGSWTAIGSTINFEGAFDSIDDHNLNFSVTTGLESDRGPLFGGADAVSSFTNVSGFGDPGANYKNSRLLTVDGVTFENVYPYNDYASAHGTDAALRLRHTGSLAFYRAALNATMSANLPNFTNFTVSDPKITFNTIATGSHTELGIGDISANFFGASKEDIAGGFAHEGVSSNSQTRFNFVNAGGNRWIITSDDLRNHAIKHTFTYVADGIWRNSTGTHWYISTTGSDAGSNLTQAEWIRRVHKTFHLMVSGSGLSSVPNYTIDIFSGSAANNYRHQFNITGSLTASNAEELTVAHFGGVSDRRLFVDGDAIDGYGRFNDGGAGHTNVQRILFDNDDTGLEVFRITIPHDDYPKAAYDIDIKATGSVTSYFNRVSQSLNDHLTNYTILNITDMGSDTRKFTIRANQTGSIYNSDINSVGHLVTANTAMSGGYLQYNQFDENWILLASSGSGNHLFKLDKDGHQPHMGNREHAFGIDVQGGKFHVAGELVTGSVYSGLYANDGKQQADLVLVRGSTYRFRQSGSANYPAGGKANHHPIVFHTSPLTSSQAGDLAEVTSSWATGEETPVRYRLGTSDVTYNQYLTGMDDGGASPRVIFTPTATTPDRLFYGCGNHANMGGRIYVVDAENVRYTTTVGAAAAAPTALRDSIASALPRLTVAYNDLLSDDQAQAGTPTDDNYLPEVKSYLIRMTGSTVSGSFDDVLIIASGSSWNNIHQVTGAMTYLEGQMPGQSLHIGWGIHPDTSNRRFKSIGIGGLFGEDPFAAISDSDDRSQDLHTSVYTGSHTINTTEVDDYGRPRVALTDPYYLSSSTFWTNVSASIMNTGQYTIESMTDSHHRKYKIFKIVSKYRQERFNFNDYSGSLAATTPPNSLLGGNPAVLNVTGNFFGHGLYTSSVDGLPRNARQRGVGIYEGGFSIDEQIKGAKHPSGVNLTHPTVNTAIEFQTGFGETIRIRGDASGWRDRVGDPAKTIYWDWWGTGTGGNTAATATQVRNSLSGAWSKLTASNGVPYYQIVSSVGGTATIPANSSSPYANFYALTASTTGSEFNFIVPAVLAPFSVAQYFVGDAVSKHISGSAAMHTAGGNGTDADKITPERHGSHYVTGGVTFKPIEYYSSRVNVNPREQALLEDGDRNKTIITSRFYGGGGPEVMTEAFLDVHAKEKSVYSSLAYRHLLVKNDSGEPARFVHETDEYGETVIYAASASVSVTSHAGRREGLNTLHSRHTGRFGVDSRHGIADSSDYASPVLRRTFGVKSTVDITYSGAMGPTDKLELAHPDEGVFRIQFVDDAMSDVTQTSFTDIGGGVQRAYVNRESDCINQFRTAAAVGVLLNNISGYSATSSALGVVTLTADAIGPHFTISLTETDSGSKQAIGSVIAGDAGASAFSDTGGGGYEASFHKVHRNTFVRPDVSTALRHPSTTKSVVGLLSADIAESVTYPSSGQMSFSFWARLDADAETNKWKYVVEADGNENVNSLIVRFLNNRIQVLNFARTGGSHRAWKTRAFTGLKNKWNHFCIVWNTDDITQSPTVYLNATPYSTTPMVSDPGTGTGAQRIIAGRIALTGDDQGATARELQGALQDVAFYNTGLTHTQVNELYDQQDLYSVSFVDNIIEWWPLRSPVPTGVSPIGVEIPKDTKIFPAIGATVFITPSNIRGVPGRGKQPRRDNFYIQNILPQSDYNYSWVETSLGSNYSVRSGKQNVFGYWPKDGILVRNVKKGATGTYYETQVTASNFDSAINFPTGSDIFGSFES